MSSVLEALKRMEEEEENGPVVPVERGGVPSKSGMWRWILPLTVIIAGTAGVAGGFYLAQSPEPVAVAAEEPTKETPVFRVVAPVAPSVAAPERGDTLKTPTAPVVAAPAPVKRPEPETFHTPETPVENNTEAMAATESEPMTYAAPEVAEAASPVNQPEEPVEDVRSLPAADASTYNLQGVRWSETPSRRIAVINSQILREGGVLDGAKILTITAEGVVLDVDGSRQFLAFSGR